MNHPWIYMCSPSRAPLPPPSPPVPSRSSQCTRSERLSHASNLGWWSGSSVHGILQARTLERVAMPSSRRSSQPRDRTQVSCFAGGFFVIGPQGKPKNTGVSILSLLQWIFLTQEVNQLSYIAGGFSTSWATREALPSQNVSVCNWEWALTNIFFLWEKRSF